MRVLLVVSMVVSMEVSMEVSMVIMVIMVTTITIIIIVGAGAIHDIMTRMIIEWEDLMTRYDSYDGLT